MPDDEWFDKIDPLQKLWLFESWQCDEKEKHEFAKEYGIFIGAFSNLEMAKQLSNPGGTSIKASDEQFEKLCEDILAKKI